MRADIRRFHSPDIDNLPGYEPDDPELIGFLLQVLVGPAGLRGEESFDVEVCTPAWFLKTQEAEVAAPGRHTILITRYDWPALEQYVRRVVESVAGADWHDLAKQLNHRLGHWEFEDYTPWDG